MEHDLMVPGFQSRIRLCADSLEPGACFGFCVSLSLCLSPARALSLKNKQTIKKKLKQMRDSMEEDTVGNELIHLID